MFAQQQLLIPGRWTETALRRSCTQVAFVVGAFAACGTEGHHTKAMQSRTWVVSCVVAQGSSADAGTANLGHGLQHLGGDGRGQHDNTARVIIHVVSPPAAPHPVSQQNTNLISSECAPGACMKRKMRREV